MEDELKNKLQSLKSDGKKKKGCTSCKKKAATPITLPEIIEEENIYMPSPQDIQLAYLELGNRVANKQEFINKVYRALFDEDFNFGCRTCVNGQARRLRNYIKDVLKLPV
jgi:hypothetical protein